jgi:hypothetical protein
MKKKVKRFQEGGFSKEQEEWLGGADRTDPYILACLGKAVPDKPMANDDSPAGKTGYGEQNELPEVEATKSVTKPKAPVRTAPTRTAPAKTEIAKEVTKDKLKASDDNAYLKRSRAVTDAVKKTVGEFTKLRNYNPLAKLSDLAEGVSSRVSRFTKATPAEQAEKFRSRSMTAQNNMKAGGKVSSASKRSDGCAVRGKTRA